MCAGIIVVLPPDSRLLVNVMLASQTFNGVLLPVVLIVMLRLVNDRQVMGRFVNGRFFNLLAWGIVAALIALTGVMLITSAFPELLN